MKLAYLLSEYPTLGHTYLLREVRQLRELGWDIQTISIRRPGRPALPRSPQPKRRSFVPPGTFSAAACLTA